MPFIEWDEKYSVNVKEIDEQHKGLFQMMNDLNDAVAAGKAQEIIDATVHKMIEYAKVHFTTEEKYMTKFNYHDYPVHKAEHDKFSIKVMEMNGRLKAGVYIMSTEIARLLKDWLTNHILVTDKKYSAYFNENGLI
ncbi:MAG: bacteriohemerythrin [bacterium]|nr:bacteriohemerythrin [bacterium]MDD5354490.1 bacteriohemerythrin [bacterium]MDD5755873.1 bacteriohemerythrin [bacterium]